MAVTGWKLEPSETAAFLDRFMPEWPDVITDHISRKTDHPLPHAERADIARGTHGGAGLQAMAVGIDASGAGLRAGKRVAFKELVNHVLELSKGKDGCGFAASPSR